MNTNPGKNGAEVLNLTEEMVRGLILKTETAIHDLVLQREKLAPELKSAEELYFPLRDDNNKLVEAISKEKNTLAVLIGYRDNKNLRKNIRVLTSVTNSDKGCRKTKRYKLMPMIIEILSEEQRFMSPDALVIKIFERNPELTTIFQQGKEKAEKAKMKSNILTNASGRVAKKPKTILYNDKVGLAIWLDQSKVPFPKYLKSVMIAQEVASYE